MRTGELVTLVHTLLVVKEGLDCRKKLCALVDQDKITLAPDRVIRSRGTAGSSFTTTDAMAVLLLEMESAPAKTLAVLVKMPSDCARATMVAVAEAPLARLAALKVITPPSPWDQEPWFHCAETNERPGGSVSVRTTPEAVEGPRFVTTMVKVILLETSVEPGDALCDTLRSAAGATVTATEAELLAGSGSKTPEPAVAVFVTVPAALNLTVSVAVAMALLVMVPMLNATRPGDRLVVPRLVVADTSVAPAGKGLVKTTDVAVDGPRFVRRIVKITLLPAKTELLGVVIPRARLACELMIVGSVEELFAGLKSASKAVTEAELLAVPPSTAVVVMVTRAPAPLFRGLNPHTIVPLILLQLPEVFVTSTKLTKGDSMLVSTMAVAIEGPLLVMPMVYTRLLPMKVGLGVADCARVTSAMPRTLETTIATLLDLFGSKVGVSVELSVATFVKVPATKLVTIIVCTTLALVVNTPMLNPTIPPVLVLEVP